VGAIGGLLIGGGSLLLVEVLKVNEIACGTVEGALIGLFMGLKIRKFVCEMKASPDRNGCEKQFYIKRYLWITFGAILGGIIFGGAGSIAVLHFGPEDEVAIGVLLAPFILTAIMSVIVVWRAKGWRVKGVLLGCFVGFLVMLGLLLVAQGVTLFVTKVLGFGDVVAAFVTDGLVGIALGWTTGKLIGD